MIAFPGMLVAPAQEAGMAVPPDPDEFEEYKNEFPHFFCFCLLQLGSPMISFTEHWTNAKVIAAIPKDKLIKMQLQDFIAEGVAISFR